MTKSSHYTGKNKALIEWYQHDKEVELFLKNYNTQNRQRLNVIKKMSDNIKKTCKELAK